MASAQENEGVAEMWETLYQFIRVMKVSLYVCP